MDARGRRPLFVGKVCGRILFGHFYLFSPVSCLSKLDTPGPQVAHMAPWKLPQGPASEPTGAGEGVQTDHLQVLFDLIYLC